MIPMSNYRDEMLSSFVKPGYYVEAGAHDGIGDSQTYHLEKAGWQGICVEPSRANILLDTCGRNCKIDHRCISIHSGSRELFRQIKGEGIEMSGMVNYLKGDSANDRTDLEYEDISIETITLTDLLLYHQAPRVIEFLCLDIEGAEFPVLRQHDFSQYLFLTMAIEYNKNINRKNLLLRFLEPLGYKLFGDDNYNIFVTHASMRI